MAVDQHKSMAEIIRQAVDFFGKAQRGEIGSVGMLPWIYMSSRLITF